MAVDYCVYCGQENPGGGYCHASPAGEHVLAIDGSAPDPYLCCASCGEELSQIEIEGFVEHVCNPQAITALREADDLNAFNCLGCEEWITGEEAARRMDGYCDECAAKRELDF